MAGPQWRGRADPHLMDVVGFWRMRTIPRTDARILTRTRHTQTIHQMARTFCGLLHTSLVIRLVWRTLTSKGPLCTRTTLDM